MSSLSQPQGEEKIMLNEKQEEARNRICHALDYSTVEEALEAVENLSDFVGLFKVGKQLHTAACNTGIPIVDEIRKSGNEVFLDLKYHDVPATVGLASKEATYPGIRMFNTHIASGKESHQQALERVKENADRKGVERPKVIGVTVLTSLDDEDLDEIGYDKGYDELVRLRTELALKWGLDGIVCPANKAGQLEEEYGSELLYVTPGIKSEGVHGTGQKQLYTPDKAVQDCSNSILVIGSAIRKAENPRSAAKRIMNTMAENL